jgi:hypothetical protein
MNMNRHILLQLEQLYQSPDVVAFEGGVENATQYALAQITVAQKSLIEPGSALFKLFSDL